MQYQNRLWTKDYILLCLANLVMSMSFYFLISCLPVYIVDGLKQDKSSVGLIIASYTLAALLIRPFTGSALDIWGRKKMYLISFLAFGALFGGYYFVSGFTFFLVLRFLHGFTWGVVTTSGSTVLVDVIPAQRRGEGLGYYGLSMTIGMALGPYLGLIIMGQNHFDRLFFVGMALALTGFMLASMVKYQNFVTRKTSFSYKNMFEPLSFPLSLSMMLVMVSYGGLMAFISLFTREYQSGNAGQFFILFALGLTVSRIFGGKIFDRRGPLKAMVPSFIFLVVGFPMLAYSGNSFEMSLSSFVLGVGYGLIFPVLQAMVNNLATTESRGAANSTLFTALDIGIGIGSLFIGWLSEWIGMKAAFAFTFISPLSGGIVFFWHALPHYRKNHNKQP